jgi:hypothetical protein
VYSELDGSFVVHLIDAYGHLEGRLTHTRRVKLRFSKTSGVHEHTFGCEGGAACTEITVMATHLQFASPAVHITDTSTVEFGGRVLFPFAVSTLPAGTADPEETFWPTTWDPA